MESSNDAPSVQFRILPDGHHVEVEGGGTWSMPHDTLPTNDIASLEWRLRYAAQEQVVKDRFIAAGVVECYRELIFCTEKRRRQVIKSLRAAYKAGAR